MSVPQVGAPTSPSVVPTDSLDVTRYDVAETGVIRGSRRRQWVPLLR